MFVHGVTVQTASMDDVVEDEVVTPESEEVELLVVLTLEGWKSVQLEL
jgi:hypothetical protein